MQLIDYEIYEKVILRNRKKKSVKLEILFYTHALDLSQFCFTSIHDEAKCFELVIKHEIKIFHEYYFNKMAVDRMYGILLPASILTVIITFLF